MTKHHQDGRKFQLYHWIIQPPYHGLVYLIFSYLFFISLTTNEYTFNGLFSFDFDSETHAIQILQWLNGQAWHDKIIDRANPPEGFHSIWSRIFDLPYAFFTYFLKIYFPEKNAIVLAAGIVSLLQTLGFFGAMIYLCQPLVGKNKAALIILFVLFSPLINKDIHSNSQLPIGFLHHHPWYLIFSALFYGSALRLLVYRSRSNIFLGALALSLLLAVGVEGVIPLIIICIALIFILFFKPEEKISLDFSKMMFLAFGFSLALLFFNQPIERYFYISLVEPSIWTSWLLLACGVFFAGLHQIEIKFSNKVIKAFFLIAWAAFIGGVLLIGMPQMLDGPLASLTPEAREMARNHPAHLSFIARTGFSLYLCVYIMPVLITVILLFLNYKQITSSQIKIVLFLLIAALLAYCLFYFNYRLYRQFIVILLPLSFLSLSLAAANLHKGVNYRLKVFALFFLICPFWFIIFPAAYYNMPFTTSVLTYPTRMQQNFDHQGCIDINNLTHFLNTNYSRDDVILTPRPMSSKFLFHTNLSIFFLDQHPSGNRFMIVDEFFSTNSAEVAKKIIFENNIDLLSFCSLTYQKPQASKQLMVTVSDENQIQQDSFVSRLSNGLKVDWLKEVDPILPTNYQLFEVIR